MTEGQDEPRGLGVVTGGTSGIGLATARGSRQCGSSSQRIIGGW